MNTEKIPLLKSEIIWRVLDDGAVIVTPRAGNVRVLNRVGTTIWQLINGKNSLADIESKLIHTYDVPVDQARSDLRSFIEELEKREMITWKHTNET